MPVFFQNNDYSNTLTFEGIGFMGVGIACLLGKYDYLYSHMKTNLSKDAAISLLKSRLKPIPKYWIWCGCIKIWHFSWYDDD